MTSGFGYSNSVTIAPGSQTPWHMDVLALTTRRISTMSIGNARYFPDTGIGLALCGDRVVKGSVVGKDYLLFSSSAYASIADESLIDKTHPKAWAWEDMRGKQVMMPASVGFINVKHADLHLLADAIVKGRMAVQEFVSEKDTVERIELARLAFNRGAAYRTRGGRVTVGVIREQFNCSHDYANSMMSCLHEAGWATVEEDAKKNEQYIIVERLPEVITWTK